MLIELDGQPIEVRWLTVDVSYRVGPRAPIERVEYFHMAVPIALFEKYEKKLRELFRELEASCPRDFHARMNPHLVFKLPERGGRHERSQVQDRGRAAGESPLE